MKRASPIGWLALICACACADPQVATESTRTLILEKDGEVEPKEKSSEEDRQLIALVASGDLPNDAEYLVWLLSQGEADTNTSNVISQLHGQTGVATAGDAA